MGEDIYVNLRLIVDGVINETPDIKKNHLTLLYENI